MNSPPERIRIVIDFADGERKELAINAREGSLNFLVTPECPAITNVWIAAPHSVMEILPVNGASAAD